MLNKVQSHTVGALKVQVCGTLDVMASEAAASAHQILLNALDSQGHASAIMATGNSQLQFLEKLIALPGIDWKRVTLFHMDEYLGIDAKHSASFRRYMRERVESRIHPKVFHYLNGDAMEPIAECQRYAALLKDNVIDLVCMGIGENGHLAFNDPPVANFNDPERVKIVKLDHACRMQQVGEGHFKSLEEVPQYALTLTIPTLLNATRILCIVPERRKAEAVRAALHGPVSAACPGSILQNQKNATLFLDKESASLLDFSKLGQ